LLKGHFTKDKLDLLKKSMKARIDVQYYTNRNVSDLLYGEMVENAPDFIVSCKDIINKLTEKEISEIRDRI